MEPLGFTLRRLTAYLLDCVGILIYALGLAAMVWLTGAEPGLSTFAGWALAFVTLTGPVILAFSVIEWRTGRSLGKWVSGLQVQRGGKQPNLVRALVRNIGKFLPWEVAHIGIWMTPGEPFVTAPSGISLILIGASYAMLLIQALLVLFTGVGLHDRVAGLKVKHV